MKVPVTEACNACRWVMHVESGLACFRQDVDQKDCNYQPENWRTTWPMRSLPETEDEDYEPIQPGKVIREKKDISPWVLLIIFIVGFYLLSIFVH